MTTISITSDSVLISAKAGNFPTLSDNMTLRMLRGEGFRPISVSTVPVLGKCPSQDVFSNEPNYVRGLSFGGAQC